LEIMRVLIVDEIILMGDIVANVLKDQPDMEIVGVATSLAHARRLAATSDVILISSRLPDNGALQYTQVLSARYPEARILVLGLTGVQAEMLRFVEAGTSGYVLKDASVADLLAAIRAAYNGEALISPAMAEALMSRVAALSTRSSDPEIMARVADLTPREREVLRLIEQGYSNREIADLMTVEVGTVKNFVHSLLHKLGVRRRSQAARYALGLQIAESPSHDHM
jgi:two-component system response regulator DevR